MKKIIAFAGSNSSTSINHKLVSYVVNSIKDHEINLIKLVDYPLPIFSEDLEKEEGYPKQLSRLLDEIKAHDALIISVNEHNGGPSAFFKNVLDWLSRIEYKFLEGQKVLLLSTSTGKRGALSSLQYTQGVLPRYNAEIVTSMPFPSFSSNFSSETNTVTNDELSAQLHSEVNSFLDALK